MGIAGRDIGAELRGLGGALARQLKPAVAAACCPAAAEAAAYYAAFVAYAHSAPATDAEPLLPSLRALQAGEALPGAGALRCHTHSSAHASRAFGLRHTAVSMRPLST